MYSIVSYLPHKTVPGKQMMQTLHLEVLLELQI